jgi:hypothetical protein
VPFKRIARASARVAILRQANLARAELANAMNEFGQLLLAKHEEAVRPWTEQPRFVMTTTFTPKLLVVHVEPTGPFAERWLWIDKGTGTYGPKRAPYIIQAKPGKRLIFQTGYSAKTEPIANANAGDGSRSGPWVSTQLVIHPGIRPRKFSEKFIEDLKPDFRRIMENAFRRALRR